MAIDVGELRAHSGEAPPADTNFEYWVRNLDFAQRGYDRALENLADPARPHMQSHWEFHLQASQMAIETALKNLATLAIGPLENLL